MMDSVANVPPVFKSSHYYFMSSFWAHFRILSQIPHGFMDPKKNLMSPNGCQSGRPQEMCRLSLHRSLRLS